MCVMGDVLEVLAEAAADLASRPVFGLSGDAIVADLVAITAAESQLTAAKADLVRELEGRDFAHGRGASSLPVWLRDRLRCSIGVAHRLVELGRLLHDRPVIHMAMCDGAVNAEQAKVIGGALSALPDDIDPAVLDKAEAVLLRQASRFDPAILAKLGQRVLGHVAPEVAEEALRRSLERADAQARISRRFSVSKVVQGRASVSGWLDAEAAAIVSAAIDPLSKPAGGADGPDRRSPGQRRADALTEVCRLALASADLPDAGGDRPQITVTVGFDVLRHELGVGLLDTGELLSAAAVRRLACDARIIPVVLGGDGAVLDVGRTRRLFTGGLRRALVLRDRGCAFPGCDRPPRWTVGHHIVSWATGGPTCVDNGVLLCGSHHRLIHTGDWQVRLGADSRPEFIPPAYIDLERRPQRNHHHQSHPQHPQHRSTRRRE